MSTRPNILFAIADDASHFSAYGHTFVNTPHCDRVAREGVLFENAFTTNPKCAPSRASILTGRQTWELKEACTHWCVFPGPEEFVVYPDLLEDAGYAVGHTGKGWAPGDYERRGRTRNPAGPLFSRHTLERPSSTVSNNDYAANFAEFLEQREPDQPFCFWYGCHEPHRPYELGEGLKNGLNMDSVTVPPYLPDEDLVKSDLLDYAFEVNWFDEHLGRMLAILEERGELDNTIVVATSDNGMPFPRVKGQMYEQDFNLPLTVMWPAQCPGGRRVKDLVSFTDFAPTFLEAAEVPIPGSLTGKSFLDILTSDKDGQVDPSRDRVFMGRERHDLGREGDKGYPVRCIRTPEFLYVRNFEPDRWPAGNPETGYTNIDSSPTKTRILEQHDAGEDFYYNLAMAKRPAEELYNIIDDNACMHNLAGDPQYAELKEGLWQELKALLEQQQDPRILGNGDIFDTYEYITSDKQSHSWQAYEEGWWEPQPF